MTEDKNHDGDFNSFLGDWTNANISFQERMEKYFLYYYQFALDKIKELKCNSVLDFGCADGVLIKAIQNLNKNISIHGVEISKKGRVNCLKNTGIEPASFLKELSVSKFEAVAALEILEHLSNPLETLKTLYNLTEKVLIFTVPIEDKIKSVYHINQFKYYDLYNLCMQITPNFKIHMINKSSKTGNPLNMFGVYLYK